MKTLRYLYDAANGELKAKYTMPMPILDGCYADERTILLTDLSGRIAMVDVIVREYGRKYRYCARKILLRTDRG